MEVSGEAARRMHAAERLQRCWRRYQTHTRRRAESAEAAAKAVREEHEWLAEARKRADAVARKSKAARAKGEARAKVDSCAKAEEAKGAGTVAEASLWSRIMELEQARDTAEASEAEAREAAARALEERDEMEVGWAGAAAALVVQACAPWAAELDREGREGSTEREVTEVGAAVVVSGRTEKAGKATVVAPRRTGGRQASKARLRRQAADNGTDVMDWMRIREHQRQLAEVVGGGDAWPAILEQRLEAARSQWASLQDASCCGGDAVRSYMRSTQAQARLTSEEAM
jgi:hypothetical protein